MTAPTFSPALFGQFSRKRRNVLRRVESKNVVSYTRVSGKKQEKNMSLGTQINGIREYAERNNLNILANFGGTYESAKTDGRKEFNRMLNFIKDKSEWTGTKISFEISKQGDKTRIRFTHIGLDPSVECYGACLKAWDFYISHSLLNLITKCKGEPNQHQSSL